MNLYYVETTHGCGIREAHTYEEAVKELRAEVGSMGMPRVVREATDDDIHWVKAMGGYMPREAVERLKILELTEEL